jgi:hypothetical protein
VSVYQLNSAHNQGFPWQIHLLIGFFWRRLKGRGAFPNVSWSAKSLEASQSFSASGSTVYSLF